jgi:hypothetical protein
MLQQQADSEGIVIPEELAAAVYQSRRARYRRMALTSDQKPPTGKIS